MTHVLLTGAFGNIGTKVIDNLLNQQVNVHCLDIKSPVNLKAAKKYAGKVNITWGDITNAEQVNHAVKNMDAVIHNAAMLPHLVEINPTLAQRVNVGGTENIIKAIQNSDKRCHLVFPSSISVHGYHMPDDPSPKTIDTAFKAEDDYASHKITCEQLLDNSDISFTVMRIGACLDSDSKIGGDDLRTAMHTMFNAHPECRIEYVHTKDVARALVNAINNDQAVGKKFFLGGGKSCQTTWQAFNSIAFNAMGLGNVPESFFNTKVGYYTDWMDTDDAQKVLQFQQHSLGDYQQEFENKFKWMRILGYPLRPVLRHYLFGMSAFKPAPRKQ